MLILTRNVNQRIFINGEEIKIVVLSIKGNQVKIGIDAPKNIPILREELISNNFECLKNKELEFLSL